MSRPADRADRPGDRGRQSPDGDRLIEVEAIFSEAVPVEGATRAALLDARCAGRSDLRAEVESLLAAHARAGAFIAPPALPRAPLGEHRATLPSDGRVGPFRLLDRIAVGGMGEVFRAARIEGGFTQTVAIKLMAARLQGAEMTERFRAEQQILASLQHPNIVSLLDGGVTPDGQPYIVMEYVDGVTIAEFCNA